jgi:uncharacterized membrane protein
MSGFSKLSTRTKIVASISIFAALYAVLRIIPTVPMFGVEGARFAASDVIAPLYGILLGPYVGGISVIIGTFLGMALGKAPMFLGLDFLPALVNTVALGFLVRRKWAPVVVLYISLLAAFLINPYTSFFINVPWISGSVAVPFLWLHFIAFVVLLSPLALRAGKWVETLKPAKLAAGIGILAFIGTMMQHLMGNILYEIVFGPIQNFYTADAFHTIVWPSVFYLYPWERLALIVLAIVIGTPVVRALRKAFFPPDKPLVKVN